MKRESKRMSLGEATMMVDRLSPQMDTCFLGGPEDFHKTLFSEAFNHIVIPTEKFIKDRICIGSGNGKLNVIEAPPGSGKTHAFTYDLLWRGLALFKKFKNSPNMIAMFTSPDTSVNEAVVSDLKAVIRWCKTDSKVRDLVMGTYGLDIHNVATRPDELLGHGTEILVCTPKMATEAQNDILKKLSEETFLAFIVSDEAHRGLGCPSSETYNEDIGWSGYGYNATWFHGLRKLNAFVWLGLSGTPTKSQKSDDVYYNVISDKMTKSSFRNGFVAPLDMSSMSMEEIVEKVFLDITERNAISKYLFTFFTYDNLGEELYEKFENAIKVTAMFRSGQAGSDGKPSKWGTAEDVQKAWNRLVKKYAGTTFEYFCPWNKETVELERNPGKCAICLDKNKTGNGTNKDVFDLMNDPESGPSGYDAVAVLHIGVVGINITTLGHIGIIPEVGNDGDVVSSPVQLLGRLARCHFVWTGIGWSIPVSEIEDRDLREIAIHLSINITTKRCTSNESDLVRRAWNRFEQGHIELAGAYTYLSELVNESTRTLYDYSLVKEQDAIYREYKVENPHCEFCRQNEEGIPACEVAARENHSEDSDEDFATWLFGVLEVDHKDGDHFNNDPKNLETLCSDEHGYKTQKNKDYLNRYENGKLVR